MFQRCVAASVSWRDIAGRREKPSERHSVKALGVPYASPQEGLPDAMGPSKSDGGEACDAETWPGGDEPALVHVSCQSPGVAIGFPYGDGVRRMYVATDSDRPDAIPEENSRHCNPVLLDSCPPACLRYMGSARANRSGRSPDSGWKVFDELGRLGPVAAAAKAGEWEVLRRVRRK